MQLSECVGLNMCMCLLALVSAGLVGSLPDHKPVLHRHTALWDCQTAADNPVVSDCTHTFVFVCDRHMLMMEDRH